jgi:hypothetical protein
LKKLGIELVLFEIKLGSLLPLNFVLKATKFLKNSGVSASLRQNDKANRGGLKDKIEESRL